ncbi:hypothetical protein Hanom_Chr08g00696891 [Helianthus anomalus]
MVFELSHDSIEKCELLRLMVHIITLTALTTSFHALQPLTDSISRPFLFEPSICILTDQKISMHRSASSLYPH